MASTIVHWASSTEDSDDDVDYVVPDEYTSSFEVVERLQEDSSAAGPGAADLAVFGLTGNRTQQRSEPRRQSQTPISEDEETPTQQRRPQVHVDEPASRLSLVVPESRFIMGRDFLEQRAQSEAVQARRRAQRQAESLRQQPGQTDNERYFPGPGVLQSVFRELRLFTIEQLAREFWFRGLPELESEFWPPESPAAAPGDPTSPRASDGTVYARLQDYKLQQQRLCTTEKYLEATQRDAIVVRRRYLRRRCAGHLLRQSYEREGWRLMWEPSENKRLRSDGAGPSQNPNQSQLGSGMERLAVEIEAQKEQSHVFRTREREQESPGSVSWLRSLRTRALGQGERIRILRDDPDRQDEVEQQRLLLLSVDNECLLFLILQEEAEIKDLSAEENAFRREALEDEINLVWELDTIQQGIDISWRPQAREEARPEIQELHQNSSRNMTSGGNIILRWAEPETPATFSLRRSGP